ncbi:MAG: stage II sporulation protein M [Acidobacteria bacterium]|nr:stage II sporulation protein M [Acidobacteriota bacterium]MCB9396702.1 stage II sporulation protein M [Acidobacteriota bacterium]
MSSIQFVAERRKRWEKLETRLEGHLENADQWLELSQLYRGLCTDISLAYSYRLPEPSIQYLNQLAARTHAVLYKDSFLYRWDFKAWFFRLPYMMMGNRYVRMGFGLFWIPFLISCALAYANNQFAEHIVGAEMLAQFNEMYSEKAVRASAAEGAGAASFYIFHNVSIGLQCFGWGVLFGIGSIYALIFNGILLGTVFGYMLSGEYAPNFGEFVLAHGPFELTGICLAGACGLKVGYALVDTRGMTRLKSLRKEALDTLPMIAFASLLIFLAAFIEGFVSPSNLPLAVKVAIMALTAFALLVYFNLPRLRPGGVPWN